MKRRNNNENETRFNRIYRPYAGGAGVSGWQCANHFITTQRAAIFRTDSTSAPSSAGAQ
jgi:hypothetical protein